MNAKIRTSSKTVWLGFCILLVVVTANRNVARAIVIDDEDVGYSTTGAFTEELGGVFGGDEWYETNPNSAAGTNTATYSFTGVPSGSYFVNATWAAAGNRTSAAQYAMSDGAGTATVNQQNVPAITFDREGTGVGSVVPWAHLNATPVTITDGTFTTTLSDTLNTGYLIADAVRLVQYEFASNVYIVDDVLGAGNGFSTTGTWSLGSGGTDATQYLNEELFQSAPNNGSTATWSFTGLAAGQYRISTTWASGGNRTSAANFSMTDGGGVALLNQQSAPNDFSYLGLSWENIGLVTITDGAFSVTASHSTAGFYLMADAVRLEFVPEPSGMLMISFGTLVLVLFRGKRRSP